eukprot:jgi/Undpi1/2498/HiC_scaffold_13.g05877.m1
MADEGVSPEVPPSSAALTADFVSGQRSSFEADPKLRLAQNAVTRVDVRDVLMRRDVSNGLNHHYSVKVAQTAVTAAAAVAAATETGQANPTEPDRVEPNLTERWPCH